MFQKAFEQVFGEFFNNSKKKRIRRKMNKHAVKP